MSRAKGWEDVLALQLELRQAFAGHRVMSGMGLARDHGFTSSDLRQMFGAVRALMDLAEPVFVSADVLDLWDEARQHFAPEHLHSRDLFVPAGFALLPRPLVFTPGQTAIRAFGWASVADGVSVFGFSDSAVMEAGGVTYQGRDYTGAEAEQFMAHFSPWQIVLILNLEYGRPESDIAWRTMQAFWRLGQEFVRSRERLPRPRRREAERLAKDIPEAETEYVTVLRLRRLASRDRNEQTEQAVDWSCQWVVRGHWRNQWYPSEQRHRQRYVGPHVKGPLDKPLRLSDRVVEFVR